MKHCEDWICLLVKKVSSPGIFLTWGLFFLGFGLFKTLTSETKVGLEHQENVLISWLGFYLLLGCLLYSAIYATWKTISTKRSRQR